MVPECVGVSASYSTSFSGNCGSEGGGIKGNGLQVEKYALLGPHPLRERAVKSWSGPMSWAEVGVDV